MLPLLGRRVLDLGSGAGFPGVPMALAEPNASVTLCESRGRKVRFLEASVEALGLRNARAVEARAEDHLADEGVDLVARAVSSVRETVRLPQGSTSVLRARADEGGVWSREMRAAEREAERLGFHFDTVIEYELPDDLGKRPLPSTGHRAAPAPESRALEARHDRVGGGHQGPGHAMEGPTSRGQPRPRGPWSQPTSGKREARPFQARRQHPRRPRHREGPEVGQQEGSDRGPGLAPPAPPRRSAGPRSSGLLDVPVRQPLASIIPCQAGARSQAVGCCAGVTS